MRKVGLDFNLNSLDAARDIKNLDTYVATN